MPKKDKRPPTPSESDDDEEFDEDSSSDNLQEGADREVNREHLLNYESDSSDDGMIDNSSDGGSDGSLNLAKGLSKQKEELTANPWGQSKKGFYGRDKHRDDDSSSDGNDEDEYQEAIRLQKVRAKKLQMMQQQQKQLVVVSETVEKEDVESVESSDSEIGQKRRGKLGDLLFSGEQEVAGEDSAKTTSLKALLSQVKSKTTQLAILDQQAPELKGLIQDFDDSLRTLTIQLKPLLPHLPQLKQSNRSLATFIELKYNLLLSYCTYLSYYLLLRQSPSTESIAEHPVLFKIVTLRKTLEGLQGLDAKIDRLSKNISAGKKNKANKKSKKLVSDDESEINMDEYDMELEKDGEDASYHSDEDEDENDEEEGEEEDIDDEEGEDDLEEEAEGIDGVENLMLTREEQKQLLKQQANQLGDRLKKIKKDDFKSIISSSKAPTKKQRADQKIREEGEAKRLVEETKDKQRREQRNNDRETEEQELKKIEEARAKKRETKLEKKQQQKEAMAAVENSLKAQEDNIVRNVNYTIMKSKGLTRKRKKIERNSRVKHREKYKKALTKRKSRVQDFQEGPKGKYGGESSGFKSGIIRSTALN